MQAMAVWEKDVVTFLEVSAFVGLHGEDEMMVLNGLVRRLECTGYRDLCSLRPCSFIVTLSAMSILLRPQVI
jgi:hypothetical protein